jgi:hypothetical protein
MEYIIEPQKNIPVAAETEVLVVGGGPSGFGAALTSARMGRRTMLIEQYGAVGGVATTGIMSHWTGRQGGGLFEEFLFKAGDCECPEVINPEKLKILMLNMLIEAGVTVQLYTWMSDVIKEGNRITGVITESKSGREAIRCKVLIDSTGDGDAAAKAGAPFEKGRSADGGMQPMTIMFKLAGVDMDRAMFFWGFEDTVQLPEGDLQTLSRKELPAPAGHVLLYPSSLPGVVTVNMTNSINADGTNIRDINRAELECRNQMGKIVAFLRHYVPGYEACYICDSSNAVGVRETRRFLAEYQLNEEDIAEARVFDDWVVTKSRFFFDLHNVTGSGLDNDGAYRQFKQEHPYTIPKRCLIPREVEGVILNGRNIGGTHKAHSSYRVMPICMNIGQAAGVIAALSIEKKKDARDLDISLVQEALRAQNVEP